MSSLTLPGYPRPRERYDEMCADDGTPRPHWRALAGELARTSPAQWREREDTARRRIRENGVTYNVYADPKGADRPWALDIVPLVLAADEWAAIAAAVAQRATLLDRVLADLYGPQRLLEDKSIPPALVYGHNGYLWPCHGIVPPGGRFLHAYAADLARSPDGHWWVIADRTQAPSGAGYALENRQIVSRLYPALQRDLAIQPLNGYLRALQTALLAHAPVAPGETPTVALLTPGPLNETYFEHVYLARQLGFLLAEGQDLTVRGDTLFLKTVAGLRRVHALLRRLDDDWCDPLDLRSDSTLGVAGLVDVARAGRVLIANALGSGVLESPGITGFLPGLCERLLGEPLRLPSVATWWCGEAAAREFVEENLATLVLKPAYPSQRMEPVFGDRLDEAERASWIARIRARPNAYVAQELVHLSQAPTLATDLTTGALSNGDAPQLQPRTIGLRVYAVADGAGSYRVMPGGLARVAGDTSIDVLSMQRGGSSKDTWVIGGAPRAGGTVDSARHDIRVRDLVREPVALSSRAAENLFWLGRYAERVDSHARLLRVAMQRLLEGGENGNGDRALLASLCVRAGLRPADDTGRADSALLAAVFDERLPGSLANDIRRVRRTALHAREWLSTDHWQAIERLAGVAERARQARPAPRLDLALALLDRVLLAGTTLLGHATDDMARDAGWRFLGIGRRIERLQHLVGAVQTLLWMPGTDSAAIEALLELTDSADTWRRRYLRAPELLPALDIVVFDAGNPHAIAFQAAKLQRSLARLADDCHAESPIADGGLEVALKALRAFPLASLEHREAGARDALAAQAGAFANAAAQISDQLANRFFTHVDGAAAHALAV